MINTQSSTGQRLKGVQVSTNNYGRVIPVPYGRTRTTPMLTWANDFTTGCGSSKKGKGSKGGLKGKKGKGGPPTYCSAVDFLLGVAVMRNILQAWRNKDYFQLFVSSQQVTVVTDVNGNFPNATITNCPGGSSNIVAILGVTIGVPYDYIFDDYGSGLETRYTGIGAQPMWDSNVQLPPLFQQFPDYAHGDGNVPYVFTYFPPDNILFAYGNTTGFTGQTVTIYYAYAIPKSGSNGRPLTLLNLTFEPNLGTGPEYVHHTDQQIIYGDCSGAGSPRFDLGSSGSLPNLSLEVTGLYPLSPGGDCNPADVIFDMMDSGFNTFHGLYIRELWQRSFDVSNILPAGPVLPVFIDSLTPLRNYCYANQIYLSFIMDTKRKAADWLQDILDCCNTAAVWSGFKLKLLPYSEVSAVGDTGIAYIPACAAGPLYDIGDGQYLSKPPVVVKRQRQNDAPNIVSVEHLDRDNQYNIQITTEQDQRDIYLNGAHKDQVKAMHMIQTKAIAQKVASVLVKKSTHLRNTYEFTLPATYIQVEPMDLVTLTDSTIGLNKVPVRITEVNEDEKFQLNVVAEDFMYGINAPTPITVAASTATTTSGSNNDPGNTNPPIIFDAIPRLRGMFTQNELWFGLSGQSLDWGGCTIWASSDGVTYTKVGRQMGDSIMGALLTDLPNHADPDDADNFTVDLILSQGDLTSFTAAQRDQFTPSICYVAGGASSNVPYELIAYYTANLISPFVYQLIPRLRRSVFASGHADHPIGSNFLFLGAGAIYTRVQFDPIWVGKSVFFKFTSFNTFGGAEQPLAAVTAYSYTPTGSVSIFNAAYSLTPAAPTSQPLGVGDIVVAPFVANFPSGDASYGGTTIAVGLPGSPTDYWVTVFDPAYIGDTNGPLNYFADTNPDRANTSGYTYIGKITVTAAGGVTGGAGGSNGPR